MPLVEVGLPARGLASGCSVLIDGGSALTLSALVSDSRTDCCFGGGGGSVLDVRAATLGGKVVRLALRRAAHQRWWPILSATWVARGGVACDPGVVILMSENINGDPLPFVITSG